MKLAPRFNLNDPGLLADPYPAYARLREAGRTARGGPGQIVFSHYEDVLALLKSGSLGNEFPPEYRRFTMGNGPAADFLSRVVLHRDPPAHRELRRLLGCPLAKPKLPELAGRAWSIASELLDDALPKREFDAVDALAQPLPVLMICEMLGVPARDRAALRPHASTLGRAFKLNATDADRKAANDSLTLLRGYLDTALDSAPANVPCPELIAEARRAVDMGLDRLDVLDNLVFLFFAGFETTTSLIGTALARLSACSHMLERLQTEPGLLPAFIEECLRYEAPIQSRARLVREPVQLGEKTLRPGRIAVLLIGSANRDPSVFDSPDEFDMTRKPNPHLSFGAGPHFCLGSQLAKIETEAILRQLTDRCGKLTPVSAPQFDESSVFRCYRTVPVRAERR